MSHIVGIPAEARGIVRRWKAQLALTSERIYDCRDLPGMDDALESAAFKKGVGRDRAIKKIRRSLPGLRLETLGHDYTVWSFLAPCEPLIQNAEDAGQRQRAVSANFLVAGRIDDHFVVRMGMWTLEIPDHALHRLVQRWPRGDLTKALWDSHKGILAAASMNPLPEYGRYFYLPAGAGVWAGQFVSGTGATDGEFLIFFRARTWLHEDQLYEEQEMLSPGTPSMGEREMLPYALRLTHVGDDKIWFYPAGRVLP